MRRIIFMTLAAALIALTPATAYQGNDEWRVFVSVPTTPGQGMALAINLDGEAREVVFPDLSDTAEVALSPDGCTLAYCAWQTNPTILTLWDIEAGRPLWTRNFGDTSGCIMSKAAFASDGETVAAGIRIGQDIAGDGPRWRIVVLQADNGDVIGELNDQSPIVLDIGLDLFDEKHVLPMVKQVDGDAVIFVLPNQTQGDMQAYQWSRSADTLRTIDVWGQDRLTSYLPETDERVWLEFLPESVGDSRQQVFNVVWMADADGTKPIFYQAGTQIHEALLVNDGRQLLLEVSDPAGGLPNLVLLNRDGTWTQDDAVTENGLMFQIAPAPGGYVVLRKIGEGQESGIRDTLEYVQGDDVRMLWTRTPSENDPYSASLLFAASTPAAADLAPFRAITLP